MSSGAAFWDSSVLVPLCVRQDNSDLIRAWTARHDLVVWWSARVEISGAIARLRRSGKLDAGGTNAARFALDELIETWREVVPSDEVRDQASALLDRYALRAADSLQLAAALVWCRERPKGRAFLCADAKLAEVAAKMGFAVLQP